MIKRDKYFNRIVPYMDKPMIKVITGIRRCGKGTFLKLLIKELEERGVRPRNILYTNKDSLKDFTQYSCICCCLYTTSGCKQGV